MDSEHRCERNAGPPTRHRMKLGPLGIVRHKLLIHVLLNRRTVVQDKSVAYEIARDLNYPQKQPATENSDVDDYDVCNKVVE